MRIHFSKKALQQYSQPEIDGRNRIQSKPFGKNKRWSIVLCRGRKVIIEDNFTKDVLEMPSIIWSGEMEDLAGQLEMLNRVDNNEGYK